VPALSLGEDDVVDGSPAKYCIKLDQKTGKRKQLALIVFVKFRSL
jgi:hypothetical protein